MKMKYLKLFEEFVDEEIKAAVIIEDPNVKAALVDAEEGKLPSISITIIESAKFYTVVSLDVDKLYSRVYETSNHRLALVAFLIQDRHQNKPHEITDIIRDSNSGNLRYTVFPGNIVMTPQEIASKYNFKYRMTTDDSIPYYTSTPRQTAFF